MHRTNFLNRGHWAIRRLWERLAAHQLPIVLLYHHISNTLVDPSRLSITEEHFEEQIDTLCRMREVVSLEDVLDSDASRRRSKPLAAITFDDGYRSVIAKALPILEAHHCPSTLFICSRAIDSPREFWWDELARIVFQQKLPTQLSLQTPERNHLWQTGNPAPFQARQALYDEIWSALLPMKPGRRILAVDDLARQTGAELEPRDQFKIVNSADLASLEGSRMELGAHTASHPSLPLLDRVAQEQEIQESLEFCRRYSRTKAVHFSYPFGDHNHETVDLVRQMGFASAVTTMQGVVRRETDRMRLPRYTIHDWSASKFGRSLP